MINDKKFVLKFFGIDWEEEKENEEFLIICLRNRQKISLFRYKRHYGTIWRLQHQ